MTTPETMTSDDPSFEAPESGPNAEADRSRLRWDVRLSDAINPIVVREVVQATSGRLFLTTILLAVAAVLIVGLFATVGTTGLSDGRETLSAALSCLVPIVLFILPLQAFTSMREEVSGGTADQLLLTRLSPLRIVWGKLLAAVAMFVLFLGMFAPLIGLTYLLRGVDVVTIAIMIGMAFLASLVANAFAIALGALSRIRALSTLTALLSMTVLAIVTMMGIGASWELVREVQRSLLVPEFPLACSVVCAVGVFLVAIFSILAQAVLAHEHENRSSPFRVFVLLIYGVAIGFLWFGVPVRELDEQGPATIVMLTAFLSPVLIGLASEARDLSPRVSRYAPKNSLVAFLMTPFMPGGGRGALFVAGLIVILAAFCWLCVTGGRLSASVPSTADVHVFRVAMTSLGYLGILTALSRILRRSRLGKRFGFWSGIIGVALLVVLGMVLSLVWLATGMGSNWSGIYITNIPWTVVESDDRSLVAAGVFAIGALAMVFVLPDMIHGIREVQVAAAKRKELDAA